MRAPSLPRLITVALLLAAAGCLPNREYRPGDAAVERKTPGKRDYDLSYVEFDEQGDFWDRDQLARAVGLIKQTPRPLLVVYVHGWQNNASGNTNDVSQFHDVLAKLARTGRIRELGYQVVGVYLGWRGKQAYDPFLKILSFPNRKSAAVRIGSSNTITEAIFRLVYEARHPSRGARTILIGHSFGALVVERAVEQAMTGGLLTGNPVVPADFILLVNAAAESIYAKEMRDMMVSTLHFSPSRHCYQGSDDSSDCFMKDEPRIISVTSETDRATGVAFPVGATLFGVGKLYRTYSGPETGGARVDQRLFFTHTPGHNSLLLDHRIVPLDVTAPDTPKRPAFEENLENPQALPASGADAQATPIFATGGEELSGGEKTPWNWWRLNYTGNPLQRSPFWIVQVPKEILNGHGDIFNPNAIDMMAALFRLSNLLDSKDAVPIQINAKPKAVGQPLAEAVTLAAPGPLPNNKAATASIPATSPATAQASLSSLLAQAAPSNARRPRERKKRSRKSAFLHLVGPTKAK